MRYEHDTDRAILIDLPHEYEETQKLETQFWIILFNGCFKAKYRFMSREQGAGQNHSIDTGNKSRENV